MRYRSLILPCRPVNLVDAFTSTFFHTADPDDPRTPMGLSFPVEAGSNGFTLSYYTRAIPSPGGYYAVLVDTSNGIAASLDTFGASGQFRGQVYVDGQPFTAGPFTMYQSQQWRRVELVYPGAYPAGEIHLNHIVGEPNRKYSYLRADFARPCFYDYVVSPAAIAAPLMPSDYKQLYTATGYQLGDASSSERTGTGLDAIFYY